MLKRSSPQAIVTSRRMSLLAMKFFFVASHSPSSLPAVEDMAKLLIGYDVRDKLASGNN
jgi:hypothetical protein